MDDISPLARLRQAGLTVTAAGDTLHAGPVELLDDELRSLIRASKSEILAALAEEARTNMMEALAAPTPAEPVPPHAEEPAGMPPTGRASGIPADVLAVLLERQRATDERQRQLEQRNAALEAQIAEMQALARTPPVIVGAGHAPSDDPAWQQRVAEEAARRLMEADRNYFGGFAPPQAPYTGNVLDQQPVHHETPLERMRRLGRMN
jgi:hypothetical protein